VFEGMPGGLSFISSRRSVEVTLMLGGGRCLRVAE
jgi:hypothetical protein